MINKVPLGKTTIASYLAALFLIKEHSGITEEELKKVIEETLEVDFSDYKSELNEWYLTNDGKIEKGKYALTRDIALPKTGELLAKKGTMVEVTKSEPVDSIFEHLVFKAKHAATRQDIYITQEDITK